MASTALLEGNGLLDMDDGAAPSNLSQPRADELFPSTSNALLDRDLNIPSLPTSQSEAQKALNAWGSRAASSSNAATYARSPVLTGEMDFDGDLDLDMLLDEETAFTRERADLQPPASTTRVEHDDDELEAFLLAEDEHMASRPPQPSSAVPASFASSHRQDKLANEPTSTQGAYAASSRASSSVSDLLESNGLLGQSSQPSSQHSIVSAQKPQPAAAEVTVATVAPGSSRAIEALSTFEAESISSAPALASGSSEHAGPSRLAVRPPSNVIPKYIPAGFLPATTMDGTAVRFERRKRMKGWKPPAIMTDVDASQLLERPIHQLLEAVEALKALDVVEQKEAQDRQTRHAACSADADGVRKVGSQMWVDKHRPAKFTELLGDERIHREVLGWLKEWDECVFKRKNHRKERHRQYIQAKYGPPTGSFGDKSGDNVFKDPHGRPKERVMMISGPPGLGKTTLAHIVGAHAGYNVYELNASDARSAGAVEDVIKMALESGSLKDPRPTLVVIDEIDGATGGGGGASGESHGFIRALVRLIESGKGSDSKAGGLAARGKKQRKGSKPLLRPIICICNDLYAPSLRPLRPMAKLVRFHKPPTNLVVKRLREVCEAEALSVETRGLSMLAELTSGDIRSCLNALEFAKTKNMALTEAAVKNAAIGIKDTGGTVQKAWEMLFRRQNRKQAATSSMKGANVQATSAENAPWNSSRKATAPELTLDGKDKQKDFALVDTPQENVSRIIHEVTSCNEYEKLALGCFEHYPTLRAADGGWKRYRQVHDWLHFGQCISARAWSNGNFELLGFMPWSFVCWHLLFAHVGNALPEYPKVDYENHLKSSAFNEIVSQIATALPAGVRSQFNRHAVITELGPSLMRILTPDLRPINNQLARAEDKQVFSSLVAVMNSLNIKFVPDKISEEEAAVVGQSAGTLVYKLEPPLDVFTQFEGKRSKDVGPSRFAVRQLVAREMERQLLRKNAGVGGGEEDAGSTSKSATAVYRTKGANAGTGPDPAKAKEGKVAVDFFGRPIVGKAVKADDPLSAVPIPEGMGGKKRKAPTGTGAPAAASTTQGEATSASADEASAAARGEEERKATDDAGDTNIKVFYRYHEGFSNAVRRPMKMSSLL